MARVGAQNSDGMTSNYSPCAHSLCTAIPRDNANSDS
jgi:hypothetical protein